MSKSIEKIWEDPFHGVPFTSSKTNSIEDIWNTTIGPNTQMGEIVGATSPKGQRVITGPSWDQMGKPMEAFATKFDDVTGVLPPSWRQYAPAVASAVLSYFGTPLAGAAFNTAYAEGERQKQGAKGTDWGRLGKDAAMNFGTAAVGMGASSLLQNAQAAQAAKNFRATGASGVSSLSQTPGSTLQSTLAAQRLGDAGSAMSNFGGVNSIPALQAAASGAGAVPSTATNLMSNFSPVEARDYTLGSGSTTPITPTTNASQGVGIGDMAYNAGVKGGAQLANESIVDSLAPKQTDAISDTFDGAGSLGGGQTTQWGDVLSAFGGDAVKTPNASGPRISEQALSDMVGRLGSNSLLQQMDARDRALPAGQYRPAENTPYANRLNEINLGTDKTYKDLLAEADNANKYFGVIDSNPGITEEELNAYLLSPGDTLGKFTVDQGLRDYLKGVRPLTAQNTSLTR